MSLDTITFILKSVSDSRLLQETLAKLRALPGVAHVAQLSPNSGDENVRRMGYLQPEGDADLSVTLQRIRAIPEIDSADVAAERRLR
jgi:hypothetical protein